MINSPPDVPNVEVWVVTDTPNVVADVAAGATDADGIDLGSLRILTLPAGASATPDGAGRLDVDPTNDGLAQTYVVGFELCDQHPSDPACTSATLTVYYNDPPSLAGDSATAIVGLQTSFLIDLLLAASSPGLVDGGWDPSSVGVGNGAAGPFGPTALTGAGSVCAVVGGEIHHMAHMAGLTAGPDECWFVACELLPGPAGTGTTGRACSTAVLSVQVLPLPDFDGDGIPDAVEDPNGSGGFELCTGGLTPPDCDPSDWQDPDTDDDALDDGEEGAAGTSPLDADTDEDGLSDGHELDGTGPLAAFGPTDPLDPDTDADGLTDGLEAGVTQPVAAPLANNGAPLRGTDTGSANWQPDTDPATSTDPTDDDTDDDGLLDGTEDANADGAVMNTIGTTGTTGVGETDPADPDTDADGIQDGTERGLSFPEGSGTALRLFRPDAAPSSTTDPLDTDTDDGGVPDGAEDRNGNGTQEVGETDPTDPADDDTDMDGLTDAEEGILGTDPNNPDTDGDGLSDGQEILTEGTDPLDPDMDEDGLPDGQEGGNGGNPLDADTDDDGLADGLELILGTALGDADTDDDGLTDGMELGTTVPVPGGVSNNGTPYAGTDVGSPAWRPDSDPASTTDPRDDDSDDDGLLDGTEDANRDGATVNVLGGTGTTGGGETDPAAADTDGDGIQDGTELGVA